MGFEREPDSFRLAARWLRRQVGANDTFVARLPRGAGPRELADAARRAAQSAWGRRASSVVALLFEGEPYEDARALRAGPAERRHSAVRALCEAMEVDLLFL